MFHPGDYFRYEQPVTYDTVMRYGRFINYLSLDLEYGVNCVVMIMDNPGIINMLDSNKLVHITKEEYDHQVYIYEHYDCNLKLEMFRI